MVVVIDGYNLLKNIFSHQKDNLKKQREHLVKQLSYYKQQRADKIKELVIVFDGGLIDKAAREVHGGIVVVFSGKGKSADWWIEKFVERNRQRELLVISNDRALITHCKNKGADALRVEEFYHILQDALVEKAVGATPSPSVQKLEDDSAVPSSLSLIDGKEKQGPMDQKAFDLLMEQASLQSMPIKQDEDDGARPQKGPSQTLSKEEKKKLTKVKKLL